MTAVMYRMQTVLQLEPPSNRKWNFGETLAKKDIVFFRAIISQHTLMILEYNVLCTQLTHDFVRKDKNEEQLTQQLISALMYAQLFEHIFRNYLNVPREVIRLQKEQKIYQTLLQQRGFTFPNEEEYSKNPDVFSQFVRNQAASINWPRLSLIRAKRVLDSIVPLAKEFEKYCHAIALLDAFTNPIIAYLSWIFFIPRLSVNVFLLMKHVLRGPWMDQPEKDLGAYTRIKGQLLRRWFEIFNDAVWLVAGLLGCFILLGSLAPIGIYANVGFFVYDVVLASIRFNLEMGRLNKLKKYYNNQENILRNAGASAEEIAEVERFQSHLQDLINFERLRLLISVVNTSILAFAVIIAIPAIAVTPVIPIIAAILLFTSTVGAYLATQIIEKERPPRNLDSLINAKPVPIDENSSTELAKPIDSSYKYNSNLSLFKKSDDLPPSEVSFKISEEPRDISCGASGS